MRNNKGFGKFEVLTVTVVVLIIIAVCMKIVLGSADEKKFDSFKSTVIGFDRAVYTNIDEYHNSRIVYLSEVLDKKLINKLKNPFSSENCSLSESKIVLGDGTKRNATLKCSNYLIEDADVKSINSISIYKVSDWSESKTDSTDLESKELYNIIESGKELFEEYYEADYLVYQVNKLYTQDFYDFYDLSKAYTIQSKTFYRTKTKVG